MTTLIIDIKDSSAAKKIADALRLMDSVTNITIEEPSDRIPGLAYTKEERIASVRRSMESVRAGKVYSLEEVYAMFPES